VDIKRIIETEDGTVFFQGTLTGAELEAVITVGLNTLLQAGALPYLMENDESNAKVVFPENPTEQ
jgi:hypothetical protein